MHRTVWFMTLRCVAVLGPVTKVFVVMFEMRSFLCFVFVHLGALFQIAKFVSKSPFSPAAPFSINWLMCWNMTSENPRPAPHKSETWQSSYCERVKGQKRRKYLCSMIFELNLFVCSVSWKAQRVCYFGLRGLVLFLFLLLWSSSHLKHFEELIHHVCMKTILSMADSLLWDSPGVFWLCTAIFRMRSEMCVLLKVWNCLGSTRQQKV